MQPARRTIRDGPFCWASKAALRHLRERFRESNKIPVATAVYFALCEIASDEQNESFRAKISAIADRSGVSYKTALEYLRQLELADLVDVKRAKIEGTNLDAPSTYTLLPLCSSDIPLCNGGVEGRFTDISEESKKNLTEEKEEKKSSPEPPASRKVTFSTSLIDEIYSVYPRKEKPVDAKKAIDKALNLLAKRGTPEPAAWLKDRVSKYAISREGEDPKFTPYPTTWFNAGSYDVDFTTPPTPVKRGYNGNTGTTNDSNTSDYSRVGKIDMSKPITRF